MFEGDAGIQISLWELVSENHYVHIENSGEPSFLRLGCFLSLQKLKPSKNGYLLVCACEDKKMEGQFQLNISSTSNNYEIRREFQGFAELSSVDDIGI